MDEGLPVNPWQSRTAVLPPEWWKGSAPGITGMLTLALLCLRTSAGIVARRPVGAHPRHGTLADRGSGRSRGVTSRRSWISPAPWASLPADHVGRCERVLLGGEGHTRPVSRAVPPVGGGDRERAPRGAGHPGQQPSVVRGPFLRS